MICYTYTARLPKPPRPFPPAPPMPTATATAHAPSPTTVPVDAHPDATEMFARDERKDLLRLVTAGSVDDGKSTLIGRLLFESKGIYEDQLDAIRKVSPKVGTTGEELDLALVTDGLKAEREQGITIDVAYRYFSTPKRKFIIADSPGHEQYTRNMVTGASTADLAIVLIDAKNGVTTQSRRHAFIASLLGIPHVVVAVNKIDLVKYSQDRFNEIVDTFTEFSTKLDIRDLAFIPMSALKGDNVVEKAEGNMPWYDGRTLLGHLENVHIASDRNLIDLRLPVQYVSRPNSDFRGFMGTPAAGVIRRGDDVTALPSGVRSTVKGVYGSGGEPIEEGFPPVPVTVTLEDEIDVSRGDMLVHTHNVPRTGRDLEAMVVWMSADAMQPGKQYTVKHTTRLTSGVVSDLRYRIDVNTLHREEAGGLKLNEIGRCSLRLAAPIAFDPYAKNRTTGAFILIDRLTHNTVGCGMILDRQPDREATAGPRVTETAREELGEHVSLVTPQERETRLGQRGATVWLTGLTGAGKTAVAYALERRLFDGGKLAHVIDGRNARLGLSHDLDFTAHDRAENLRRAAEVARMFNAAGLLAICSFLSPSARDRQHARDIIGEDRFLEVHLDAPPDVARKRVRGDSLHNEDERINRPFFDVDAPYEAPEHPAATLRTHELSIDESVDRLMELLRTRGLID